MIKEQSTANPSNEQRTNPSEDMLSTSLTAPRIGPYRSLSAKRPRDPSHRKSVSFNDVPIVHEVPSHDAMRNSNCDSYRSWTYTDATPPTSVMPSYYTPQIFSPFNSSNAAAQKLHASRLSSTLYSTPSTFSSSLSATTAATTTATITPNRIPDWAIRTKTPKPASAADESPAANEHTSNPSVIVVHASDEKNNKDSTIKPSIMSPYSSSYTAHSQQQQQQQSPPIPIPPPPTITISSFTTNHEHADEKKHPYRSALMPDNEHHRSLPFTYGPLSDSTATYTSMLSTHLIQSNHPSNEQPTAGHPRIARARSATLPVSATHSPARANDTVSITPIRTSAAAAATGLLNNGSSPSTRTVLRPTTIAFQCSQPATTPSTTTISNTNTNSSTTHTAMATNNMNLTNLSPASASLAGAAATTLTNPTTAVRPPAAPPRYGSAAAAAAHSRFIFTPNRPFNTSTLTSSAIKYAFAHPSMDSSLSNTISSHATTPKPPPTAYPRSRSAHALGTRRAAASPVVMLDGQTNGGAPATTTTTTASAANAGASLYAATKRNPNVRQTYGSYYMHRVLLPTTIN